jgi:hypothetical protein
VAHGIAERRLVSESSAHVDDGGLDAAARFLGLQGGFIGDHNV